MIEVFAGIVYIIVQAMKGWFPAFTGGWKTWVVSVSAGLVVGTLAKLIVIAGMVDAIRQWIDLTPYICLGWTQYILSGLIAAIGVSLGWHLVARASAPKP